MLEDLDEFTRKSWVRYSGPAEKFAQYNIFFGENGQGKSSLACEIALQLNTRFDVSRSSIAFFDRNYVKQAMLLRDSESAIRGIRADFGEQNVAATKEVEAKKNHLTQIEEDLDDCRDRLQATEQKVNHEIDFIFKKIKGKSSIQNKRKESVIRKKDAWIEEYVKAKKRFPQQVFSDFVGDAGLEQQLEALGTFQIPSFMGFSEEETEALGKICLHSYDDLSIPSTKVIEWIKEGLDVHSKTANHCLFCGSGSLDISNIEERLQGFLNAESAKAEQRLNSAIERLNGISSYGIQFKSVVHALTSICSGIELNEASAEIDECCNQMKVYARELSEKAKDMGYPHYFNSEELNYYIAKMDALVRKSTARLAEEKKLLEEKVDNFSMLIKGAIGYEISQQASIEKGCQEYADIEEKIMTLESEAASLKNDIMQLEQSKMDISDFAAFLNDELEALSFPFRLTCNSKEKSYSIALADNNKNLTLDDISEGERNLLAFAFFFFSLYQDDKQERIKDELKAIIIDDAISSVDERNLFYLLSMLRHLLKSGVQLFLFTHVWTDFTLLTAHGINNETTKTWRIGKYGNSSQLSRCSSGTTPYKELFAQVYEFSQMPETDPSFESVALHMPNALRRVLEEYLNFNSSVRATTSSQVVEIGKVLFANKDWSQIKHDKRRSVELLVNVTNAFSHRAPKPDNGKDVHECAKFFMNRIEAVNPSHFHAMKQ